jgi:hypothetical protein
MYVQPPNTHLAQINVATAKYGMAAPEMADFAAMLNVVNGLAERTPGFV